MTPEPYDLSRLQATFDTHLECHDEIGSTNDRARQLAAELPAEQTALVLAERQTAGRGRGANRWWTGGGSLALSWLTRRQAATEQPGPLISLAVGLAVVDAVSSLHHLPGLGIHWPNDVFVQHRKLAGVLVEALPDGRHVVGIGLNANNRLADAPWELAQVATTLCDLLGGPIDRTQLVMELVEQLTAGLDVLRQRPAEITARADRACLQRGHHLTVVTGHRPTSGICLGVADDGALLLDTPTGRQAIYSGVLQHAGA